MYQNQKKKTLFIYQSYNFLRWIISTNLAEPPQEISVMVPNHSVLGRKTWQTKRLSGQWSCHDLAWDPISESEKLTKTCWDTRKNWLKKWRIKCWASQPFTRQATLFMGLLVGRELSLLIQAKNFNWVGTGGESPPIWGVCFFSRICLTHT